MDKKKFVFVLIGIIALMILTFTLDNFFDSQTKSFGFSCGTLFMSTFCLVCYKDALKPLQRFGSTNMTKKHYEKKGELHKYQQLCKILFIITFSVGAMCLIIGFIEIFIFYFKLIFAN